MKEVLYFGNFLQDEENVNVLIFEGVLFSKKNRHLSKIYEIYVRRSVANFLVAQISKWLAKVPFQKSFCHLQQCFSR